MLKDVYLEILHEFIAYSTVKLCQCHYSKWSPAAILKLSNCSTVNVIHGP